MGAFSITSSGSFGNFEASLKKMASLNLASVLEASGRAGAVALAAHTPQDSGLAAHSWMFEISTTSTGATITWHNTDIETGFPVALMLQYGYATGTGGYVQGRDYINPAIEPIFQKIANDVWKAVTSA